MPITPLAFVPSPYEIAAYGVRAFSKVDLVADYQNSPEPQKYNDHHSDVRMTAACHGISSTGFKCQHCGIAANRPTLLSPWQAAHACRPLPSAAQSKISCGSRTFRSAQSGAWARSCARSSAGNNALKCEADLRKCQKGKC